MDDETLSFALIAGGSFGIGMLAAKMAMGFPAFSDDAIGFGILAGFACFFLNLARDIRS